MRTRNLVVAKASVSQHWCSSSTPATVSSDSSLNCDRSLQNPNFLTFIVHRALLVLDVAFAKGNKYAWVPTTSLYSATDQVISPEGTEFNDTSATSFLGGYTGNLLIQGMQT